MHIETAAKALPATVRRSANTISFLNDESDGVQRFLSDLKGKSCSPISEQETIYLHEIAGILQDLIRNINSTTLQRNYIKHTRNHNKTDIKHK